MGSAPNPILRSGPIPRPAIRVLAGGCAGIALLLCRWQVHRDGERNEGRERALVVAGLPPLGDTDPADATGAWRTVAWSGQFTGPAELLAGTQMGGELGYDVVQAWARPGGERVMVNRGWVSAEGVDLVIQKAQTLGDTHLTGQLRPVSAPTGETPVIGHGTRIWGAGHTGAAAEAVDASRTVYVVAGSPDGSPGDNKPPTGGFTPIPERDDTSLHYASQWLFIAAIGLLFAFPHPLIYLRQKYMHLNRP